MAGSPQEEEAQLWATFTAQTGSLTLSPQIYVGATAIWLRQNLVNAIENGTWDTNKGVVHGCTTLAGKAALALQPVFNPYNAVIDEPLFSASVWVVKKYLESQTAAQGIICA